MRKDIKMLRSPSPDQNNVDAVQSLDFQADRKNGSIRVKINIQAITSNFDFEGMGV